MIRQTLPLIAATALTAPVFAISAAPAAAAEVQMQVQGPVVELSVTETVKAQPDLANVSAGVTSRAPTAVAAMRQNAAEMDRVIKQLKAIGIDEDDIQTSGINLNAQFDYDRTSQRQIFRGYQVSNRVSVTLRSIEETGRILDALVAAGATDLGGPTFSIDDDTAAQDQARKAAWAAANARANEYARMAGYSGIRLLEVNENVRTSRPQMMMGEAAITVTASRADTPVQPGLVGTAVTMGVKFEMTR